MNKRHIFINLILIVLGVGLNVATGVAGWDAYWGGMGTALIFVGIFRFIRSSLYLRSEAYREKVNIELQDERIRYIRAKAWAWAGYWFVIVSAVASIILRIVGRNTLAVVAGLAVCTLILLYWISYLILRKKY